MDDVGFYPTLPCSKAMYVITLTIDQTHLISMLAINHYSPHYINECRKRVNRLLEKYRSLVLAIQDEKVLAAFESEFYNTLIILLDAMFINRVQPKLPEGTALHEVRDLTQSLLNNEDILQRRTKETETYVLNLKTGSTIRLNEEQFLKLAHSYFEAIENQFFMKA